MLVHGTSTPASSIGGLVLIWTELDSAAEVAESWNETVKRAGYDRKPITVKDIQSVMGKTMDVIARILFPDLEEDERQKLLAQCGEEENEYLRIHGATL